MGLVARANAVIPPNNPPEWTGTPNPIWLAGVADTYEMADDTFDQEGDALTYTLNSGSTALPTGVTISGSTLVATILIVEATTTGVIIDVKDADSGLIASSAFSIAVNTLNLAAFPDAEGFGTETTHGRTGIVVQVTNLNDSGAGSLREALLTEQTRIIIFRVSGTVFLDSIIKMGGEHSNIGIFGQTAPGGGICIAAASAMGDHLVQVSNLNSSENTINECHDLVFQHIRMRHGSRNRSSIPGQDCFDAFAGTFNLVLDHCSFTWASDETVILWDNNSDTPAILDIHDITISHCIIAEGDNLHNTGVLLSGGDDSGDNIHSVTYHHNYSAHLAFRDIMVDTGSGDSTKGVQAINNVHYDILQHHALGQNQYSGEQTFFDSINECFIRSSREVATGNRKFNVNRLYTLTGFSSHQPTDDIFHDVSLHVTGSIQREIDLTDTDPSSSAAEADNTIWIVKQYQGNSSGGGPYDSGETFVTRGSEFSTQPVNPVTVTTALQCHTDLIVNGDCGALPHDAVDARIVAACTSGEVYDRLNVPGYPGSTATWPTLTDTGALLDTSGNGLPDEYQVDVLGKSASDAYNPANAFTVGNGYSDIENWIHTL